MVGRGDLIREGEMRIGLDAEDIKLLYSLTPETFAEFRERINALLINEKPIVVFCPA